MGMLRTLFFVGAAFALMPSPPPEPDQAQSATPPGTFAYVAAAAETVADLRGFCQRNPHVCSTAGTMASSVEGKAKYSAKLIYEWANEAKAGAGADPIQTASPPTRALDLKESQNTLSLADLVPAWKKPKG